MDYWRTGQQILICNLETLFLRGLRVVSKEQKTNVKKNGKWRSKSIMIYELNYKNNINNFV